MHPAASVIFFTTASGCGYGMLLLIGLLKPLGLLPDDPWFGAVAMGLALVLVTGGLLSSTFHLGHPERAWRAISQWRSSWLSREGVMSLVTYLPAMAVAVGWVLGWGAADESPLAGLLLAGTSLATLYTTAMIYRSLKTIHQWHTRWTVWLYLTLGPMTGAIALAALLAVTGHDPRLFNILGLLLILAGLAAKIRYWGYADDTKAAHTPASALGLKTGHVRSVEWPHTESNFVMKEMGYKIGRKHAQQLRKLAVVLLFAVPFGTFLLAANVEGLMEMLLYVLAFVSAAAGVLIERWLFFAEAKHTVQLYYGAESA